MTELIQELYKVLQDLRTTLSNVQVSEQLRKQIDDLLLPVFENETSRAQVSEIINNVGDFSENILFPLIEQYVSSEVALRVKFLVEDLLTFVEKYRDALVKRIEKEKQNKLNILDASTTFRANTMKRLAVNSATNHYRAVLHGNAGKHKMVNRFGSFKSHPGRVVPNSRSSISKINMSKNVNAKVTKQNSFSPMKKASLGENDEGIKEMSGIGINAKTKLLEEYAKIEVPELTKSGQILVKVNAVGLNAVDIPSGIIGGNGGVTEGDEPPHVTQIKALSKSILSLTSSGSNNRRKPDTRQNRIPDGGARREVIGREFCGRVVDIAWQSGDFLHRMNVSKDDVVYGIIGEETGGCLGEYVVCNVKDVSRAPSFLGTKENVGKLARLGLDGGVVCRALASTDITNPRNTRIVILGACTNKSFILLELLHKDLGVPLRNIKAVVSEDEEEAVLLKGDLSLPKGNVIRWDGKVLDLGGKKDVDIVYDCLEEGCDNVKELRVYIQKEMRASGQYVGIETAKVLREKKHRDEDWQKEFSLLNNLVKGRKLTLGVFENNVVVPYTAGEVGEAVGALQQGRVIGKPVVLVTEEEVQSLKERHS